jgi:hypothetical protein
MKNIAWVILLVISAISVWQYVSNKNERIAADILYKALQSEYNDTLEYYGEYVSRADSATNNATAAAIQAGEAARQAQGVADQQRKKINWLLSFLDSTEKETPDSTWKPVSPNYTWGCDSLRRANMTLNTLVDQYEHDNQAHVDALNFETSVRDSALQKERLFNSVFRGQLVRCMNELNTVEKSTKKTQLYAGMSAWGNAITPLGGGEINLGLKTKSDQFYEIKGAYLGKWWVGVGTKFKISLK